MISEAKRKYNKEYKKWYKLHHHDKYLQSRRREKRQWRINLKKRNPYRYWAGNVLNGHRRKGFIVNISVDELALMAKKAKYCSLCGGEIDWSYKLRGKNTPVQTHPSLDRADNSKTINITNIDIIHIKCNTLKGFTRRRLFLSICNQIIDYNVSI